MGRSFGSTSIADFDDDVYGLECFGEETFGFGDVAGVPIDFGALIARNGRGKGVGFFDGGADLGCVVVEG